MPDPHASQQHPSTGRALPDRGRGCLALAKRAWHCEDGEYESARHRRKAWGVCVCVCVCVFVCLFIMEKGRKNAKIEKKMKRKRNRKKECVCVVRGAMKGKKGKKTKVCAAFISLPSFTSTEREARLAESRHEHGEAYYEAQDSLCREWQAHFRGTEGHAGTGRERAQLAFSLTILWVTGEKKK